MPLTAHQYELIETLEKTSASDFWTDAATLTDVAPLRTDKRAWSRIMTAARRHGIVLDPWIAALDEAIRHANGRAAYPIPQTGRALIATDHPPLTCFVDDILAEGLTLLAGKPKKGKSYLALDMSLSIAVGRQAFTKFPTNQTKVLYVSLEDGERRLKRRLLAIQHNLVAPEGLDFLYAFPRLGDGALEAIEHYGATYHVIIIDILGRILPTQIPMQKSLSEYQQFMDLLGPIQKLAEHRRMAVVLIDHMRKASAEDDIDTIIGSQGKGGSADHVLIYARKGEEKDGVLKVSGRDLEEDKFVLTLVDGHLEFLGKGEIYELDSEQNKIITILAEEHRPLGIHDIMKALGIQGDSHYQRFRKVLYRLYAEDRIGRTKRGLYRLYSDDREEGVPF